MPEPILPFDPAKIQRVLLYRLGSLGDTLIALPAFHLAARAFPNARRLLLTNTPVSAKAPPAAAILGDTAAPDALIHGYLRYTVGTRSPAELARLWASIVRFRPQVLVYMGSTRGLASARRDARFFRLCGIRHQIGVPTTEAMDQNLREPTPSPGQQPDQHPGQQPGQHPSIQLATAPSLTASEAPTLRPHIQLHPAAAPAPIHLSPDAAATQLRPAAALTQIGAPGYPIPDLPYTLEPEAARLTRNLAPLGPAHLDSPQAWDLRLTPAEHARAAELLAPALLGPAPDAPARQASAFHAPAFKAPSGLLTPSSSYPILAVSVGTKVQSKDWGRDNWQALLARLAQLHPGHALALAGAPEESAASEFAAQPWRSLAHGPVINLCGKLTPRESAAAFARAQLFLGHDSGPMHLAAAVGTPTVAIFAARNIPRVWFPVGPRHRVLYHPVDCMGCGLETCLIERKKCITSITVDEVLAAAEASLTENTSRDWITIRELLS